VHFVSRLFTYNCNSQLRENKQELYNFIAYLTNWHNSIFVYKLRTDEEQFVAEYPEKVKNSEPQLRIYWFL